MADPHVFVGFTELEEWVRVIDSHLPVLVLPVIESDTLPKGVRVDTLTVMCQQVRPRGTIFYCCMQVTHVLYAGRDPFGPDRERREAAWLSFWEAVESYLVQQDLTIQHGSISLPADSERLYAYAGFIQFNSEAGHYYLIT